MKFKKGNIPWNKGKKGLKLWPNGRVFSVETNFFFLKLFNKQYQNINLLKGGY